MCLGAHPAGGDYRAYFLEQISDRHWALWLSVFIEEEYSDTESEDGSGAWLFARHAACDTASDVAPYDVAKSLLAKVWATNALFMALIFPSYACKV